MMKKRERAIRPKVSFTEEEWQQIQAKMAAANTPYFSTFAREMLLTGEVKYYDFSNLKELSANLGRIAGSINQIAKRCNENGTATQADVGQLRREYLQLKAVCQERLIKMLRKL